MSENQSIRLDWQQLLGFDQAEITPAELKAQPTRAALMAKLSSKVSTKPIIETRKSST